MAFVMMPLITAAINATSLNSHGNAFLNTMRQLLVQWYCDSRVMTTQSTNHLNAFATELDKTNPVIQDHDVKWPHNMGSTRCITSYLDLCK